MAEYINKADVLEVVRKGANVYKSLGMISKLPTIDIPDTSIEFETPREQLAFICGAILEKQKRNAETE